MILAMLVFGLWALIWRWVVVTRGTWNLFMANFAGAFAGFIVATVMLVIYNGFFPVKKVETADTPVTQTAPKNNG